MRKLLNPYLYYPVLSRDRLGLSSLQLYRAVILIPQTTNPTVWVYLFPQKSRQISQLIQLSLKLDKKITSQQPVYFRDN
jgi:hypothetical protein